MNLPSRKKPSNSIGLVLKPQTDFEPVSYHHAQDLLIDAVEELAPHGFDDVERVLSYAKREAIVRSYAGKAGFTQSVVNAK